MVTLTLRVNRPCVWLQKGDDRLRTAETLADECVSAGQHPVRPDHGAQTLQTRPAGLLPEPRHQYTTCRGPDRDRREGTQKRTLALSSVPLIRNHGWRCGSGSQNLFALRKIWRTEANVQTRQRVFHF